MATNYARGLDYLESLGVEEVWTLRRATHPETENGEKSALVEMPVSIVEFRRGLRLDAGAAA